MNINFFRQYFNHLANGRYTIYTIVIRISLIWTNNCVTPLIHLWDKLIAIDLFSGKIRIIIFIDPHQFGRKFWNSWVALGGRVGAPHPHTYLHPPHRPQNGSRAPLNSKVENLENDRKEREFFLSEDCSKVAYGYGLSENAMIFDFFDPERS